MERTELVKIEYFMRENISLFSDLVAIPVSNQITTMTTTIDNSWNQFQNVYDWTTDDVMEWLSREKLEM